MQDLEDFILIKSISKRTIVENIFKSFNKSSSDFPARTTHCDFGTPIVNLFAEILSMLIMFNVKERYAAS